MNRGRPLPPGIGVAPLWSSGRAPRANLQPRVVLILNRVRTIFLEENKERKDSLQRLT